MKRQRWKKGGEYLITLLCIITINFFLPRLMPGDPFTFLSSDEGEVAAIYSQEEIQRYKAYYGLDKPLGVQYKDYIQNLVVGNLGYSIYYTEEVSRLILNRMGWTFSLTGISMLLAGLLGTFLGSLSAWYRNRRGEEILYGIMVALGEIPPFLTGILFLFVVAAGWGWFPLSGAMRPFANYATPWEKAGDMVYHAVLPVLTLTLARLGDFYLIARNSMVGVLSKDYMVTARGKGLKEKKLIFRHALRNTLLPIMTRFFLGLGSAVGGALLVENVFDYPGLGRLMRQGVMVRDYPLVQGIFLVAAILVLTMNFLADWVYKKLDPRAE